MNRAEFMSRLSALLQDVPPAEREEAITFYNEYFDDAGAGNEAGVIAALGSPEELAKSIKIGLSDGGNAGEFTESGFHGYEQRNKNQVMSTQQMQSGAQGNGQTGRFQGGSYGPQGNGQTFRGNAGGTAYGPQGSAGSGNPGWQQTNPMPEKQPRKGAMSGGKIALIILAAILLSPVWIGILGGLFGGAVGLLGALLGIFISFLVVGVVLTVVGVLLVVVGFTAVFGAPLGGLCLVGGGLIMVAIGLVFVWLMVLTVGAAIPALVRGLVSLCSKIFHRGGAQV